MGVTEKAWAKYGGMVLIGDNRGRVFLCFSLDLVQILSATFEANDSKTVSSDYKENNSSLGKEGNCFVFTYTLISKSNKSNK